MRTQTGAWDRGKINRLIADRHLTESRGAGELFDEVHTTHAKAHEKLLARAKKIESAGDEDE